MKKVFAEIGFGNDTFLSTEFEEGNAERHVAKFVFPDAINEFYLRFWIFRTVVIISTKDGFKMKKKDRNKLKLLFGIGGRNF